MNAARMPAAAIACAMLMAGCLYETDRRRDEDLFDRFERQGVPPGNLRIVVEQLEAEAEDRAVLDAAFAYRDAGVFVTGGALSGSNGLTVFGAKRGLSAALRASSESSRTREYRTSFVLVADGGEAHLAVVSEVARPATVVIPIYDGVVVVRTIETVPVGTSLSARAALRDGLVDLELIPVVRDQRGTEIRVTELSTRLRVAPGVPTVILSDRIGEESFGGAFLSRRMAGRTRRTIQVVTVEAP